MAHAYPTLAHALAAEEITRFFASRPETDAVLLTNSCARGKATADSCLDMQVIASSEVVGHLDGQFSEFARESKSIAELHRAGRFSDLHLDVVDGILVPGQIDDESIDYLEVAVGNLLVYSEPLFVRGQRLDRLRAEWLPYYGSALRTERLDAARWFVLENNLARIPWFLDRQLYFQAFDRFQRAFQGFLLGIHIARRTYPIAYNKWIREQIVDNLGLPELYEELPRLFELPRFESRALETKAHDLGRLAEAYLLADQG
jgi:hypothetical protein